MDKSSCDWADAQADLSLRWAHKPICRFCHALAPLLNKNVFPKDVDSTEVNKQHRVVRETHKISEKKMGEKTIKAIADLLLDLDNMIEKKNGAL